MKLKPCSLQLAITLAASLAPALGTLFLSNLEQTPIGSSAIGSDSWIAQQFISGTNAAGYSLNSVQLLLIAASGSPSGFDVSIYSSPGTVAPGSNLGSLSGVDPSAGGLFTYTTSDVLLTPSTFNFVVVTAASPVAQGAYRWSAVDSFGVYNTSPGDPWTAVDGYYSSVNGLSWTSHPRQQVVQFGIYATAVPEPATYALLGFGLACFGFWRRRHA